MSRRKYRPKYSANVGPMPPDNPPPVPPTIPPPSPPDEPMAHGGSPDDDARAALSRRIAEMQQAEQLQVARAAQAAAQAAMQASADPIDRLSVSPAMKARLRQHPDVLADPLKFARLQGEHFLAIAAGLSPDSEHYVDRVTRWFGEQSAHHAHDSAPTLPTNGGHPMPDYPAPPPVRGIAAPVSRSGGMGGSAPMSNRVILSPEERQLCKLSNISETDYAAQKIRLARARADGSYSEEGRR
jgi:hypothetical protein